MKSDRPATCWPNCNRFKPLPFAVALLGQRFEQPQTQEPCRAIPPQRFLVAAVIEQKRQPPNIDRGDPVQLRPKAALQHPFFLLLIHCHLHGLPFFGST